MAKQTVKRDSIIVYEPNIFLFKALYDQLSNTVIQLDIQYAVMIFLYCSGMFDMYCAVGRTAEYVANSLKKNK